MTPRYSLMEWRGVMLISPIFRLGLALVAGGAYVWVRMQ